MRQSYRIEMDDGASFVVDADARDIRAWEAEQGKSFLSTPLSYTEIAQVAYIAAKRTGVLNGQYPSYATFDAHCVEARGVKPADTRLVSDPTQPDRTGASSSRSRSGSGASRPRSKPKVPKS